MNHELSIRVKILIIFIFIFFGFISFAKISHAAWSVWTEPLIADKIRPNYNPASKPTSINIKGAKGEWLAFYVVMRGDENINNFVPSVQSTLTKGTDNIVNSNWKFYIVQYVNTTIESWKGVGTGSWPDPVVPYQDRWYNEIRNSPQMGWDKTVPANNTYSFIFEIYIPSTAVAGNYNGIVRLSGQGASGSLSQDIPVNLTVWDFSLPLQWSYGTTFGVGMDIYATADVFGTWPAGWGIGLDLMQKSATDHGIWLYGQSPYMGPAINYNNGAPNFTDGSFNDPLYGFKRWLDGAVSNSPFNPRPYNGYRPKAFDPRANGSIFVVAQRQVSQFADNGSGGTRVTSTGHNMNNGDHVYFWSTTHYNNNYNYWTISNVTADTFDIPIAFAGDDAVGCNPSLYNCAWALDGTKLNKYFSDWQNLITANGYGAYITFYAKNMDEEPSPNCCVLEKIYNDLSHFTNIIPGETIGASNACNPWAGGCASTKDITYPQWWIVTEMGGLIKPGNGGAISPRADFNSRISAYGDKVWIYTANRSAEDYNYYGQLPKNAIDSWYIDSALGGRDNAAGPLSIWIWQADGAHYYAVDSCFKDAAWNDPNCAGFGDNGDGFLWYSGYANSGGLYAHDIGGVHSIPVESLRIKLWRWGMNILEYAKLLEVQGKKSIADSQIAKMLTMQEGPVGNTWGIVADWESARETMANEILGVSSDTTPPAPPSGVTVS